MRFFTSDTHFGHENIIGFAFRPWKTVQEMNVGLRDLWNETVTNEDDVFVLGDLAMGKIHESLEFVSHLNGKRIFLIPGNHDRCHGMYKDCAKWIDIYEDYGITVLPKEYLIQIGDHNVRMCHFPYEVGRYDSRYAALHPDIDDSVLLHGHIHNNWRVKGKQINVGCDVWGWRPVSELWIEAILDQIDFKKTRQE